jgi:RecA-family ATPase
MSRPTRRHSNQRRQPSVRRNAGTAQLNGSPGGIQTFTAAELQSRKFPPVQYAVEGFVAEGLSLLAGKPKIGKSWMALDFAMAIARGGSALGVIPCKQGTVLYCALEDNQRRLQRRMRQLYGQKGAWPESFHFTTSLPPLDEDGLEWLEDWIASNEPTLVIIDTLAAVRPRNGPEHSYDADYAALAPLQKLAGESGAAIVVIHHLRKMKSDEPLDTISGTTGLTGAVDSVLVLRRDSNGTTLYGRGREIEEIDVAVQFNNGNWKLLGDTATVRRSEEREAILNVLKDAGEPLTPKAIAGALRQPANNIKQLLHKMGAAGEVEKHVRGRYTIPTN